MILCPLLIGLKSITDLDDETPLPPIAALLAKDMCGEMHATPVFKHHAGLAKDIFNYVVCRVNFIPTGAEC